ncbi:MAG: HEPN domain-containing protein [Actinomycetota bacterium]
MEAPPDAGEQLDASLLLSQIYDLWVGPEVQRRGLAIAPEHLSKALVVMPPGSPVTVFLDDEVSLLASVRATRSIAEGEAVRLQDFDDLRDLQPTEVDPDAGWVCFARIANRTYVAFDFRRNREKARRKLARAQEYLAEARSALEAGRLAPAVDAGHAAAELAVTAQMLLIDDAPPRDHPARRRWFADWTKLGNAPKEHGHAFAYLSARRGPARYADVTLKVKRAHLSKMLDIVEETIGHARARVGDRIPSPS